MARYDVTKGVTSSYLVLNNDSMYVSKGGTADNTQVNYEGSMTILNGGTANTTMLKNGLLTISKGGLANIIDINRGSAVIVKGGSASNANVGSPDGYGGSVALNGTLNSAKLYYSGLVNVGKGGIASDVTVYYGGLLTVGNGGKAYNTVISSGLLEVFGGIVSGATFSSGYFTLSRGTINNISLNKAGGSIGPEGGTINDFTLNGSSIILHGGTINNGTVTGNGELVAYSGAKVNSITFHNGYLNVWSNGTANKITLEEGGMINVFSGGKASNVIVSSGGSMSIDSGAVVTNLTITGGNTADVGKGIYDGRLAAHSGSIIKGLTIGSGTSIGLFYGCSATKVKWTPGNGVVNISSEAKISFTSKYSGVYVGSNGASVSQDQKLVSVTLKKGDSAYVAKGGVASGLEIASGGSVFIWNGGKALQTQVGIGESNSYLNVSSGGTASDVTIFEKGELRIFNGGKASAVTICNDGAMSIEGGSADGIEVETGGALGVFGGTATNVKWTPFEGELQVWGNAQITFAGDAAGVYVGTNGKLEKHADSLEGRILGQIEEMGIKATKKDEMYVMTGGKAERTSVGNNGSMHVFDGGSAADTTICGGGQLAIYNGGSASIVEVSGGEFAVWGGTATSVTINDYGTIYVTGGSAADVTVGSSGYGYITDGGSLNGARLCSGVYQNAGTLFISSGAVVSNITLEYGACLYVEKGAKVTNVTSSYGSFISTEKGASVKITKTIKAESPDSDHDEKNGWADKKKKIINSHVTESKATVLTDSDIGVSIKFDETSMTYDSYDNYVGYTDEIDFKKVHLNGESKLCFNVYATDASKFTIWRWDPKGKGKLVSVQATALKKYEYSSDIKSSSSSTYYYVLTKGIKLAAGDYYLSVESTNAAKGGNAYYNLYLDYDSQFSNELDIKDCLDTSLLLPDAGGAGSLDMPETSGSLGISDELNFGQYDVDVLADASASALAGLDGKDAWLNIASLA